MPTDFLLLEYDKCFSQLQFYDNRQNELQKQLYSISVSATVAQFALFKWFETATSEFLIFLSALSIVVFVSCFIMFVGMVINRVYFVFVARQINSIRAYHLAKETNDFENNQLYLSTNFSAAKVLSAHTMMFAGSAFITSIFFGEAVYSLFRVSYYANLRIGIVASLIIFASMMAGAMFHLRNKSNNSADTAVHGKES